jgi:hypothetical protein
LAKKINYYNDIKRDGVSITDASNVISFLRNSSRDDLQFSQQYFILDANTPYTELNLNLMDDSLFTYFFEEGADVLSEVTLKFNGDTTEFKVAPHLWNEDVILSIQAKNETSQKRLIYVYQVHVKGVEDVC